MVSLHACIHACMHVLITGMYSVKTNNKYSKLARLRVGVRCGPGEGRGEQGAGKGEEENLHNWRVHDAVGEVEKDWPKHN